MVTHELLDSWVHTLILPHVGRQTLREAREFKADYPFYGDHTIQFLGGGSLQNARYSAKTAHSTGSSEYRVTKMV